VSEDFSACFTQVQDRLAWSSTKWEKYRDRDVIPLWIADMDFPTAPAVQRAVMAQAQNGNYGYMSPPRELAGDLVDYYQAHYDWRIEPEWIVWLSGLVLGLNLAVRTCCDEGGSALTFSPVYPPFLNAAPLQGRRTLNVPLQLDAALHARGELRYRIDFAALEAALAPDTQLLLLCHPHNPAGSLFSSEELAGLADFCVRHDLTVCSDEVHCDLILDGQTPHVPIARLLADRGAAHLAKTITLHGPGKVFNIAGLGIAWAIIPDAALRNRFRASMKKLVPDACCFGFTALQAALREGEPWRLALLAQLRKSRDKVSAALDAMRLPHSHPDMSYLTWIDARRLGKVGNVAQWFEQNGVGLSDGADFGAPGFLRLNFAAPDVILDEALGRMQSAVSRFDAVT
jgi:cysteine-S-conjugate beta-lyase